MKIINKYLLIILLVFVSTPSIIDKIQTVEPVEGIEALGPDYFIELNKQTGPGLGIKQQDNEIIYHKGKQSKKNTKK